MGIDTRHTEDGMNGHGRCKSWEMLPLKSFPRPKDILHRI